MSESRESSQFSVLFVCTGNICRSPLAEQLFSSAVSDFPMLRADSAGTMALRGAPMTEQAANLSSSYGGRPREHRAKSMSPEMISDANLILTATRAQRSEVVSMLPKAIRKTFTLREFARLMVALERDDSLNRASTTSGAPLGLDSFVDVVRRMRGLERAVIDPGDDDIVDPYRQSQEVYDEAGKTISGAVRIIAEVFSGLVSDANSGPERRSQVDSNSATDLSGSSVSRIDR